MPVKELPMPPVKVQKPDTSGNAAFYPAKPGVAPPVPQLAAVVLNL
jgi:hypothetical protein